MSHGDGSGTINTRFVALDDSGMLLAWPPDGGAARVAVDEPVEVYFEYAGEHFSARARSVGRTPWGPTPGQQRDVWKLTLPLRVQRRQERAHYRVSLADVGPLAARFINTNDRDTTFEAQLTNISAGGLGAVVAPDDSAKLRSRELYWVDFTLPDDGGRVDFVLRLVHNRQTDDSRHALIGCQFCPGEDAERHAAHLSRVEQFVARRARARLSHVISPATGGA